MTERRSLRSFSVVVQQCTVQAPAINQHEPCWRLLNREVNARHPRVFQDKICRLPTSDSNASRGWREFVGNARIRSFQHTQEQLWGNR